MKEVKLTIPSDPKFLRIIRSTISHLSKMSGLPADEINAVTLAVDEAASNIIRHTYEGDKNQKIVVFFRTMEDQIQIIFRDFGNKVDPKAIKPRNLDEVRPGGLGVHLIRSTMDIVQYDNSPEVGNKLKLVKYLPEKR